MIAPDSPQVLFSERPELKRIYDEYASLVEPHDAPYRFGFLADGTPITAPMRMLFHETRTRANPLNPTGEKPSHAFDGDHFREWLRLPATPVERVNGFNRLALAVWRSRVDLQVAFPHPFGPGFRQWCRLHGTHEGLPEWALPGEPLEPAAPVDQFGVNVMKLPHGRAGHRRDGPRRAAGAGGREGPARVRGRGALDHHDRPNRT